ncbi:hypothetical protein [Paenarthrobacter sp. 4246]|uniref:hypothetical protein n=1 Tax=Paenarthrobacter sp. 4246 TaxID=3156456 RepID=UPI003390FEAC
MRSWAVSEDVGDRGVRSIGFRHSGWCVSLASQVLEGAPRWRIQLASVLMLRGERWPTLRSCPKYSRAVTRQASQLLSGQFLFLWKKNREVSGGPFRAIQDILCHEHGASFSAAVWGTSGFALDFE